MPLLDHFHPPILGQRHWESFHAVWCSELMAALNLTALPPGYYAETQTHLGTHVEMDVATFQGGGPATGSRNGHALAVAEATALIVPTTFPDDFEVQVINPEGGPTLVGAIELVSPGNKDRPDTRRAFASKVHGYLQRGIGLVVVDIVTSRHANMHDELIDVLEADEALRFPGAATLYAVSYRPAVEGGARIEARPYPMALGQALPTPGLALRRGPIVPVDLDGTYALARRRCLL